MEAKYQLDDDFSSEAAVGQKRSWADLSLREIDELNSVQKRGSMEAEAVVGHKRKWADLPLIDIDELNSVQKRVKGKEKLKSDDELVSIQKRIAMVQGPEKSLTLLGLGIDLLAEILGWLPAEDLQRACLASKYLLAISKMSFFRRLLRTQHGSVRTGPFLGIVFQWGGSQIYLRSPVLRFPLKTAAAELSEFLLTESRRMNFTLRDCRDGRVLLSTDRQVQQFLVWSPFDEQCCSWLPMSPVLAADGEDLISATFVPDDTTRGYTIIAVAIKVSDRSIAIVKKFVSSIEEWIFNVVQCSFQYPARSKLRPFAVVSHGCVNILNPSVGFISIDIQSLTMRLVPLPGHVTKQTARSQILCRNKEGSLCYVTVKVVPGIPGRGKDTLLSISVFDWIAQIWNLSREWPVPKSIPCLDLVGFSEGSGSVIAGNGWHSLYVVDIDGGTFSDEIKDTGCGYDVLSYEVEYPSTSWCRSDASDRRWSLESAKLMRKRLMKLLKDGHKDKKAE